MSCTVTPPVWLKLAGQQVTGLPTKSQVVLGPRNVPVRTGCRGDAAVGAVADGAVGGLGAGVQKQPNPGPASAAVAQAAESRFWQVPSGAGRGGLSARIDGAGRTIGAGSAASAAMQAEGFGGSTNRRGDVHGGVRC